MLIYLIDGNNVIHEIPEWKKMFNEDAENAKDYLIQKVVDHFKDKKIEATIFFDGFKFNHSFSKISNNVSVKHAKNKTADETILLTIQKEKNKKNIVVVTSDNELIAKAKLYQCRVISSKEFIKSISRQVQSSMDKPIEINKSEIEYWLKLFNEKKANK